MAHKNPYSDIFWFAFQEQALSMGSHSARKGFGVPLLPPKVFGIKTAGFGALEQDGFALLKNRNKLKALGIFEKAGLSGFKEAEATAAWRFGTKTASSIGKRYLIGRAAGIGLAAFNLSWQIPLAVEAVKLVYGGMANQVNQHTYANLGGYFPETEGSYTGRQRAMQAITASRLQARSAIGNEAMLMHR
jgi:hypothetical protein